MLITAYLLILLTVVYVYRKFVCEHSKTKPWYTSYYFLVFGGIALMWLLDQANVFDLKRKAMVGWRLRPIEESDYLWGPINTLYPGNAELVGGVHSCTPPTSSAL